MSEFRMMPKLSPTVLKWARETAGMSVDDAAAALGVQPIRVTNLEAGTAEPSRSMLGRMAKQYRRSLLTFYLAEPPKRGDRGQDFRTLPPEQSIENVAVLDALIRDLKARNSVVRSILEDEEESLPLAFIGSIRIEDGVASAAKAIHEILKISLAEYRTNKTYDAAFDCLRDKAETAGIFVLLVGDLGSHHSAVPVELFRGFAIADPVAPFVIINDQDSRPAWTFTLLHELAHLMLGTTGISGTSSETRIEKFCNDVAGEFLLPSDELRQLQINDTTPTATALELIADFARPRLISRAMVTYKLLRTNKVSRSTWLKLDSAFQVMSRRERETYKAQQRKNAGGPSYYVVRRHRLGKALIALVNRTLNAGAISTVSAAKALGVKPRSVYPLLVDSPRSA